MEFEIGDIVEIICVNDFDTDVEKYIGETGEIIEIDEQEEYPYCVKVESNNHEIYFAEDELELIQ